MKNKEFLVLGVEREAHRQSFQSSISDNYFGQHPHFKNTQQSLEGLEFKGTFTPQFK